MAEILNFLNRLVIRHPYCCSVNSAFSTLRTLIPTEPKDRKLSKIETLRLASSYISHLGTQLIAGQFCSKFKIFLPPCYFLGPIDQPCLRFQDESQSRHQVCTFCIANKKAAVRFLLSCHTFVVNNLFF